MAPVTFESLAKDSSKRSNKADLLFLLELLVDPPANAQSSRKVAKQIIRVTVPIDRWLSELKDVQDALTRKLGEIGAPNDRLARFDKTFAGRCVDTIDEVLGLPEFEDEVDETAPAETTPRPSANRSVGLR